MIPNIHHQKQDTMYHVVYEMKIELFGHIRTYLTPQLCQFQSLEVYLDTKNLDNLAPNR